MKERNTDIPLIMKKVLIKTSLKNIIPDNFTQFSLSESSIIISNIDSYIHVKSLIYLKT